MSHCIICNGQTTQHAEAKVRGKFTASFLQCLHCGFIFVSNPTWLAEAYAEPINRSDTGYVWRNLWARDKVRLVIDSFLNPDGVFLDYAAGYGLFVRLMRDAGYDFRWFDLYCQNLFARGFEAQSSLIGSFEAVTAFEVFEHLTNPRGEMQRLSALTSCLIFSTRILPDPAPPLAEWWYYGLEHGQHVAFYSRKSLESLATQFGYQLSTNNQDIHLFSRKPIPAKILSEPSHRWQRAWARLTGGKARSSLTMSDHDFIVKKLEDECA
jgi:hypothetical protein